MIKVLELQQTKYQVLSISTYKWRILNSIKKIHIECTRVYGIKTGPNDFIIRGMKTIQNYTRQNNVNDYQVGKTGCFGIPKG